MRKIPVLCILLLLIFSGLYSCKKDFANEQYKPITDTSKPDLSTKITASVSGFITDENNKAVTGALVTAGTQSATTDSFGYFKINNASLSKTAAFIKVTLTGYFNGYRTFIANDGKETFIRLRLIPKTPVGTINASSGGTVNTSDGASITIPVNSVVTSSNGNAYTGTIHVAAHWLNPTDSSLALNIPGDLLGIDTAGYLKVLETYGMLAVQLTDDAGNLLQITNGKQATLNFPIPASLLASAPDKIPLWSFDETTGLWKQDGEAKKIGSNYVGAVNHFSYWNCDVSMPRVYFTTQIIDSALHAARNVPVLLTIISPITSARVAYTDTSGFVYGMIPANSDFVLSVLSTCQLPVFTKNFSTGNSDIDLGTIKANFGTYETTVTGSVTDCNNAPITNGYIQLYINKLATRVDITNGNFSYTTLACNDLTATIIAVDNTTGYQSAPQQLTLNTGVYNVGNITVCNSINTNQYVIISVDGASPVSFTTPFDVSSHASYFPNYFYNRISATAIDYYTSDRDTLNIAFTGIDSIGTKFMVDSSNNPDGHVAIQLYPDQYTNSGNININITEYGVVGGYISGNFNGIFGKLNGLISNHTITGSFRVKRTQ